ncbi:PulJ/GspJ family protein [Paenibacillus sp. GYB003]|uniref:PulJ/GspJ family protein n=1 Tax=Paenibacillus sp. GYB003 TaxID=2994392 RepID=UPI002F96DB91
MNDQRGLTLLEVTATLTILSIVMIVLYLFLASAHLEFARSNENYDAQRQINDTMTAISKNLTDCAEVYKYSENELRIVTGEGAPSSFLYKALVYDKTAGTLTLYEIGQAAYNAKTAIQYANPANYSKKTVLARNVHPSSDMTVTESVANGGGTAATDKPIPLGTIVSNGRLIRISIPFRYELSGASGGKRAIDERKDVTIKLFKL